MQQILEMDLMKYHYNNIMEKIFDMQAIPHHTYLYTENLCHNAMVTDTKVKAINNDGVIEFNAKALWDTGASRSGITEDLIDQYHLRTLGKEEVIFGDGKTEVAQVPMSIRLDDIPYSFDVIALSLTPRKYYQVIIGMDIIARGDLHLIHRNGNIILQFDCPSYNK